MSILAVEMEVPYAQNARVTENTLSVDLSDGRTISVPLEWFPRLVYATPKERSNWRLIGRGDGIHWLDIDEDVSVEGLLAGRASGENRTSLKKWLDKRHSGATGLSGSGGRSRARRIPLQSMISPRWLQRVLSSSGGEVSF
jgi:hypothetical protein